MEKLNQSQGESFNTGWENSGDDLRSRILSEIQDLENRRTALEARMREELQYMREANQSEMDVEDIYHSMTGIFEDKMRYYDNQFYDIDAFKFQVLETPGHSIGGVSLLFTLENESFVFSGDALFKNAIGRWDLPTGNQAQLLKLD